jgi:hypothetical protein
MTSEAAIALAVLLGGGVLVASVQLLPPLTSWEAPEARKAGQGTDWLDGAESEHAYCTARLPGVNCACFADKAGEILRDDSQRFAGWAYADKLDLALAQATDSCR